MFEDLFGTQTKEKKKEDELFSNLFADKKEVVAEPKKEIKIGRFPEHLGGGAYKVGEPLELIKTPRSYADLKPREQEERDHIISVALGGTSDRENLQYLKTTDEGRQEGKVSVEQDAINKYLNGKITLPQARGIIAGKQQEIKGLKPTAKERTVAGQIIPGIKQTFGDLFSGAKEAFSKITGAVKKNLEEDKVRKEQGEDYISPYEKSLLDQQILPAKKQELLDQGKTENEIYEELGVQKKGFFEPTPELRARDIAREIPTSAKDIGVDIAQSIARSFVATSQGAFNIVTGQTGTTFKPETDLQKKIFGKNEVNFESIGRETADILGKGEDINQPTAIGLGLVMAALDIIPGTESSLKNTIKQLAKMDNAADIAKILKTVVKGDEKAIASLAEGIAKETSEETIEKLIKNTGKPSTAKELELPMLDETRDVAKNSLDKFLKEPNLLPTERKTAEEFLKKIEKGTDDIDDITDFLQAKTDFRLLTDQRGVAKLPDFAVTAAKSMKPIVHQDEAVQKSFRTWTRSLLKGEQKANEYVTKIPKVNDNFDTILKYEKGIETPVSSVVKKEFNKLFEAAKKENPSLKFRENYIPQIYSNNTDEVQKAMARFMKDKGVDQKTIDKYLDGVVEVSDKISTRLKINPTFVKERAFPDYKTAMDYGLSPKYKEPAELLSNYKLELEKTVANRKFLDELVDQGKVVRVDKAAKDFQPINLPFSPKGFYAKPELAKMLNGMFRNEEMLGLTEIAFKGGAVLSKTMQEIVLSAGIPKTDINFFAIGQLVKNLTAGDVKAAVAFIRANFNKASIKYFRDNSKYLEKMANQGVNVVENVSKYDDVYKQFKNLDGINEKLGFAWDKAFGEKTFKSFLPQMQTQTFKEVYEKGLKKGLSDVDAEKLAGDTTKAFYGLIEETGRSKGTKDVLSTVLFAPTFREGIINTLFNTGKSLTSEVFNPAFSKNRKLVGGMIVGYSAYNALNKKLTGHYMWENPAGKEFDLMIPTDKGAEEDDVVYIPFMPSFLAFARNMASGVIATAKGDLSTAKQKAGSLFSMPIKLGGEIWANKDYFGREIYDEEADKKTQLKQIAGYVFGFSDKGASGGINHPFIRETYNQIATDKPLYQSLSEAMELPFKFSSMNKIQQQQFFEATRKQQADRKKAKEDFRPTYDDVQSMVDEGNIEGAKQKLEGLTDEEYSIYKTLKNADKSKERREQEVKVFERFNVIQELIAQKREDEARDIVEVMSDDEYNAYKRLKSKIK